MIPLEIGMIVQSHYIRGVGLIISKNYQSGYWKYNILFNKKIWELYHNQIEFFYNSKHKKWIHVSFDPGF